MNKPFSNFNGTSMCHGKNKEQAITSQQSMAAAEPLRITGYVQFVCFCAKV